MLSTLRGLTHFWKANLAVALGAAVASTVLTGALLAGDSVQGSLRDLTLDRLGAIDAALVSENFFRAKLADDLEAAPAIVARGTAVHGSSQTRASGVAIYGVDGRFGAFFGENLSILDSEQAPGGIFPPVVLNESLARELAAKEGDDVLLSLELPGEIPRESLLGEKDADDVLITRRLTVARVIPDQGPGRFGLSPHQAQPLNAFVALSGLQKALEKEGRVNALLANREGIDPRPAVRLEDLGLRLVRGVGHVSLESEEFFVKPAAVEVAEKSGGPSQRIFTYLATGLRANGRLLPYSMVAGLPRPDLADGEVLLNRWAADDLGAKPGDAVTMSYLVMAPGGGLVERSAPLRVKGILEMTGPGADRTLTPTFPGLDEAEDIAGWDPPFPVDLSVVRPKDEDYWDDYGAAPKAIVSLETAQRLWSTRFGNLTAVRFAAPEVEEALRRELPRQVDLGAFGLTFQPVKQQGLDAAQGSTDFSGLFLAFSFFLILSAVLLVGLLFSLAVERRAGELGLLLAVGYPVRAVRRLLLAEGAVLAGLGALVGLAGAVAYAWLLMAGLRTWWLPAVGTRDLTLHVSPMSLAIGWTVSVIVVLLAIAWTVRRLARVPSPALLAGETTVPGPAKPGRAARILAPLAGLLAVGLAVSMVASGEESNPALAFGAGASLLAAGLAAFSLWVRRPRPSRHLTLFGMAAKNGAASPGRSLLSVALVASACFVLVTVAANRHPDESAGAPEGAGGFPLFAESAVPLAHDLSSPEGRLALGLPEEAEAALRNATVLPFRVLPGDDTSCLNLYRPEQPRLLGAPPGIAQHPGFEAGPWNLLDQDLGPGVIPAIADEASATWILKLGLGDEITMKNEAGQPVRLRLVGLLKRSLFQSEMLVSEAQLLRHFPSRAGKSFFLIDAPQEAVPVLEEGLGRYGFDVSATAERLASYRAVENTYLSTFQALGGFGLLLGTLGLGIALLRGIIERRGELATLRAFGFRRRRVALMVTAENGVLLLLGVALGTLAGLLAVAPRLATSGEAIPWPPLVWTLLAVVAVGLLSSIAAVWSALGVPLLPVLKEER
ncbi:MAG TPA: ABC transporter permease [Thermoanaerobaculia bacterium]|nr:ABC transporter permease [Thermoanaerobaculia bacterium]